MQTDCDLEWFLCTAFGRCYNGGLPEEVYDTFFDLACSKLCFVEKWCPKVYKTALAIQISLMLEATPYSNSSGQVSVNAENPSSKMAVVKSDKVYDVEREYTMVDVERERAAASPANILAGIIDRCKAPAMIGARLVRSHPPSCGCGKCCGGKGRLGGLRLGDKADT